MDVSGGRGGEFGGGARAFRTVPNAKGRRREMHGRGDRTSGPGSRCPARPTRAEPRARAIARGRGSFVTHVGVELPHERAQVAVLEVPRQELHDELVDVHDDEVLSPVGPTDDVVTRLVIHHVISAGGREGIEGQPPAFPETRGAGNHSPKRCGDDAGLSARTSSSGTAGRSNPPLHRASGGIRPPGRVPGSASPDATRPRARAPRTARLPRRERHDGDAFCFSKAWFFLPVRRGLIAPVMILNVGSSRRSRIFLQWSLHWS